MLTPKLTYEALRDIVLSFPDTEETQSWEARSFRLRTHNQKSTVAASAMADRKTVGHLS